MSRSKSAITLLGTESSRSSEAKHVTCIRAQHSSPSSTATFQAFGVIYEPCRFVDLRARKRLIVHFLWRFWKLQLPSLVKKTACRTERACPDSWGGAALGVSMGGMRESVVCLWNGRDVECGGCRFLDGLGPDGRCVLCWSLVIG